MAEPPITPESSRLREAEEYGRAARILAIRSRREATGLFAGAYTSAFRGGGMEFDESRPYAPGDDARNIDWNAMARTGEPFVKLFREERDRTILLALDVSASMGFGTTDRSKAEVATHLAALLAATAGRVGDRVGLLAFDEKIRIRHRAVRGSAQMWRLIRSAAACARAPAGSTNLGVVLEPLLDFTSHSSVVFLLSDFRGSGLGGGQRAERERRAVLGKLKALSARHDVVSVVLFDPREETLPSVGRIRVDDAEQSGVPRIINSSSPRVRASYHQAFVKRCHALDRELRSGGADVLWMRTDRDPLNALMRFFHQRAASRGRSSALPSIGTGPRVSA